MQKFLAEGMGAFWLVLGSCGSMILVVGYPALGTGFVGLSLLFGLTVLMLVHTIGHLSGGHFNPLVSAGLWAAGRLPKKALWPFLGAQMLGALLAVATLYTMIQGDIGLDVFAS